MVSIVRILEKKYVIMALHCTYTGYPTTLLWGCSMGCFVGWKPVFYLSHNSMVSCQKGPTRHAYAWQIGPFWQDTLELCFMQYCVILYLAVKGFDCVFIKWNMKMSRTSRYILPIDCFLHPSSISQSVGTSPCWQNPVYLCLLWYHTANTGRWTGNGIWNQKTQKQK